MFSPARRAGPASAAGRRCDANGRADSRIGLSRNASSNCSALLSRSVAAGSSAEASARRPKGSSASRYSIAIASAWRRTSSSRAGLVPASGDLAGNAGLAHQLPRQHEDSAEDAARASTTRPAARARQSSRRRASMRAAIPGRDHVRARRRAAAGAGVAAGPARRSADYEFSPACGAAGHALGAVAPWTFLPPCPVLRRFLVLPAFDIVQYQHGARARRRRATIFSRSIPRRAGCRCGMELEHGIVGLQRLGTGATAQVHQRGIHGEAVQPGEERTVEAETASACQARTKVFLRQLLGARIDAATRRQITPCTRFTCRGRATRTRACSPRAAQRTRSWSESAATCTSGIDSVSAEREAGKQHIRLDADGARRV